MASWFSTWLGLGLLGAGLWGFFTGPQNHKLAEFGVNGVFSMIHLLSGAVALAAALAGNRTAKLSCLVLGAFYGALAGAGFAGVELVNRQLNLNGPDNLLNAGIAACALFVGLTSRGD